MPSLSSRFSRSGNARPGFRARDNRLVNQFAHNTSTNDRINTGFALAGGQLAASGAPATSSPTFQFAQGGILDTIRRLSRMDNSAAAARGAAGSELELAQAGNRSRALVDATRQAATDAERLRLAEQESSFANILRLLGLSEAREGRLSSEKIRRDESQLGFLAQGGSSLAAALATILAA